MPLNSPYSDEALDHRAKPDPLDDLIRASPPHERLVARATTAAIAAFLVGAFFAPIKFSVAIPVVAADRGQVIGDAGRLSLRVDMASLDDASINALAVLPPDAAITLIGDAGTTGGRLLGVSATSDNSVTIDVLLSSSAGAEGTPMNSAVLRIPAGSRSVAVALSGLALQTAFEQRGTSKER